ncbi:MAG: hypothetical protein AAF799_08450 [Myxococcota bacterium]
MFKLHPVQSIGVLTTLAALPLLVACPGSVGDLGEHAGSSSSAGSTSNDDGPGDTAVATDDGASAATTTGNDGTDDAAEGADSGTAGAIFDVGTAPDPEAGCRGIDFLFVVDNSFSMNEHQEQIAAAVPGFIDAIEGSLKNEDAESFHVGVITSDAYLHNDPTCNTIGDLVTQTEDHGVCGPFAEGYRFATEQDDLDAVFPCMARVGVGPTTEQPVTALIEALDEDRNGPGGCNEDFLRDDAILVVVILSDDTGFGKHTFPPDAALDDISHWRPSVLAAKQGNPDAVVVMGFVNVDLGVAPCIEFGGEFTESQNFIDFIESFGEQGILSSVCHDYAQVFADAVESIDLTCQGFTPPAG